MKVARRESPVGSITMLADEGEPDMARAERATTELQARLSARERSLERSNAQASSEWQSVTFGSPGRLG